MKIVAEIDDMCEMMTLLHRIEATCDAMLDAWNALAEITDSNLGAVRSSKKDGEPTLYY